MDGLALDKTVTKDTDQWRPYLGRQIHLNQEMNEWHVASYEPPKEKTDE